MRKGNGYELYGDGSALALSGPRALLMQAANTAERAGLGELLQRVHGARLQLHEDEYVFAGPGGQIPGHPRGRIGASRFSAPNSSTKGAAAVHAVLYGGMYSERKSVPKKYLERKFSFWSRSSAG